ncbi:hypothetical protein ACUWEX_06490 [Okibacterium fritillariae]|uniref:hypothetical protein n=1 Tax=Okibacterium fritillariae TaxID=123320 RepID=UPI0009A7D4AF|nr:hypothetical protein [Okibacterium fritillariae]
MAPEACGAGSRFPEAIEHFDRAVFEHETAEHPVTRFSESAEDRARCAFGESFIALVLRGRGPKHRKRVNESSDEICLAAVTRSRGTDAVL